MTNHASDTMRRLALIGNRPRGLCGLRAGAFVFRPRTVTVVKISCSVELGYVPEFFVALRDKILNRERLQFA